MAIKSDSNLESPHVPIDIVQGQSGAEFVPSALVVPAEAILVWTNCTAEPQVFQIGRRVLALAPAGQDGAVALTAPRGAIATATGHLQSNPAALVTITLASGTT